MSSVVISLFGIIAIGMLIGAVRVRGIALGSAAVFFVALAAGHFGISMPPELTDLGLALFVYSIGLQTGPQFFRLLKARGGTFLIVGMSSALAGAVATMVFAYLLDLPPNLAAGMYCGAGTCTPALAGVLDVIHRQSPAGVDAASVGYAAAYPFSVLAVVLTILGLPRMLRSTTAAAAAQYQTEQSAGSVPLTERAFRITQPRCVGMTVDGLQGLHLSRAIICRIKHDSVISAVRPDTVLGAGDVILAVGAAAELAKLELVVGEAVNEPMYDPTGAVSSELVVVSHRSAVGRSLRELGIWERFGVVATRVRRQGIEISPHSDLVLELGDVLRLVGERSDVQSAGALIGKQERRLDETSFIPFAAGLAIGAAVGQISWSLGGFELRLGLSGGVLLVALVLGRLGHVGPMRLYVPNAAKHFARELGLVMFLCGAGTGAGRALVPVLREAGPALPLAGAAVTLVMIGAACAVMFAVLRWNLLYGAGALSACMTNPPGLTAATQLSDMDAASVGFASIYPVALLGKIIVASGVYLWLQH